MEKDNVASIPPNHTNSTVSQQLDCQSNPGYLAMEATLDIVPVVMGQSVSAKLLWITFTSKNKDILNCNLALFHHVQYFISYIHLFILFLAPQFHGYLQKFLVAYVQIGGPMHLCFICAERYVAVIHPTSFPLLRKYKCREFCATVVWIVSIVTATFYTFSETIQCNWIDSGTEALPVFLMSVLSGLIVISSLKVARVLRNSSMGKDSVHPVKRRAFITICVTSASAMTLYIPVLVLQKYKFQNENKYNCKIIPICIFFLSLASLVHPLFYLSARGELSCSIRTNKHK